MHLEALGGEHPGGGVVHVREEDALHAALEERHRAATLAAGLVALGQPPRGRRSGASGESEAIAASRGAQPPHAAGGGRGGQPETAPAAESGGERAQAPGMGEELEHEAAVRALGRGRSTLRSICARVSSISLSYCTPDGQAVTQAMQPRQLSMWSTSGAESSRGPASSARSARAASPSPRPRAGRWGRWGGRSRSARSRRSGRSAARGCRRSRSHHTPGLHIPAGSKRSFTRRIELDSAASPGPTGPRSRLRRGVQHHARRRRERARSPPAPRRLRRRSHDSPSGAGPPARPSGVGLPQERRQVGRKPGHAHHVRAALARRAARPRARRRPPPARRSSPASAHEPGGVLGLRAGRRAAEAGSTAPRPPPSERRGRRARAAACVSAAAARASAAGSVVRPAAVAWPGGRVEAHRHLEDRAERSEGAGEELGQVVPGHVLDHLAAGLREGAVRERHAHAHHQVAHAAVARAQRPGVAAATTPPTVAPPSGGSRASICPASANGACASASGHAGLEHRGEVAGVVLDDPVEPGVESSTSAPAARRGPAELGARAAHPHGVPASAAARSSAASSSRVAGPRGLGGHQKRSASPACSSGWRR